MDYRMIYIIGNLFMAYVIYKYVNIFYSECRVRAFAECISYFGYFVIITLIHMFLKVPLLVFLSNILLVAMLSLMYDEGIKKAILSSVLICFSLTCVETVIAYMTHFIKLNPMVPFEYNSAFGVVVIRIVSYIFVVAIEGFKNIKGGQHLPNMYWVCLLTVPTGTIVMLFTVFASGSTKQVMIIVCIVIALGINLFTFYLYNKISALLVFQMNKRIVEEQSRYYEYQVQIMESTLKNMHMLRHDLKNKLSPLYGLALTGKSEELAVQIAELTDICSINNEYSKSGNSTVDSIINFKLQQAKKEDIVISTDIFIPDDLSMSTFDIAVILGNLLDNALEAVVKSPDRWIDIKMKYTKGRLILEINNSYDGIVKTVANRYLSRKEDRINHGIGIQSVQMVLEKYDGVMQITHEKKKFKVKLLMYL
ncbi:MAG: GHKL domain-containing protein [Lachnospiraceae bacterium]|nr:GHKL domain-containing protein [Lachnospiraceae bacterium]